MGHGHSWRKSDSDSDSEEEDGYEDEEDDWSDEEPQEESKGFMSNFFACLRCSNIQDPETMTMGPKSSFVTSEAVKIQTRCKVLLADNRSKAVSDYFDVQNSDELGQGGFATVCKGRHKRTGLVRAIKTMPKPEKQSKADEKRTSNEIQAMTRLDHPNIVKLFQTFEDDQCTYLVLEICSGKELFDRIIDEGSFSEQKAATVMRQIFSAVRYMHSAGVCHRDLKPENFLFESSAPIMSNNTLKVIDFGICALFDPPDGRFTTKTGTPQYVAPEVVSGGYFHYYTPACDLWSCGVVLYVLLSGSLPFRGRDDQETLQKVKKQEVSFKGKRWEDVSEAAKSLIQGLLSKDATLRTSAADAVGDPWVKGQAVPVNAQPLMLRHIENLKAFRMQNRMKKVALSVIARHCDDDDVNYLRDVFVNLDKNGDGMLTSAEMQDGFLAAGNGKPGFMQDLDGIMRAVDADGSGEVDYTEFLAATMEQKAVLKDNMLWAAFRVFDKDDDGRISLEELQEALAEKDLKGARKGEDAVLKLMTEVDTDGDGYIDFDEFLKMMRA